MKQFLGSMALVLCLVTPIAAQQDMEIESFDGRPAVAGELLVKFRDADGAQKLRGDSVRMRRFQVREALDLGESGYTHLRLTARQARRTLLELAQDPDVEYAEPNYIVHADALPNDPSFTQQWGLRNTGQNGGLAKADIDATTAWETTKGSKANVIAVVDTGIDYTHPDLKANLWTASKAFTVTFSANDKITCPAGSYGYHAISNTCDPKDSAQHGTMVSGVIAASGNNAVGVSGVNWTGSIMGLGFMDAKGNGSVSNAIRAIEFAIQAKKALGDAANIRVLNNSWGGSGSSQALLDQILKAQAAGMLFVAAAGNSPVDLDASPSFPASYTTAPNLIAVAATDNKDAIASFSSYGVKTVHVGAPGVAILTTAPGNQYSTVNGTSFSAPMTSGVAGLVLAACAQLDTAALKKVILESVAPIPALNGKTITGGRIDAYKAVRSCAVAQSAASFTLSAAPGTVTLSPGLSVNVAVTIAATGGFKNPVALTATGLPAGVTGVFTPASAAPGTAVTLKLTAAANAAVTANGAAVTIKGINGTLTATAPVGVAVKPPFTIEAVPGSVSLNPGVSANVAVQIVASGGFTGAVSLSATGLPAGVTGVFTPASAAPGATVTLKLTAPANAAITAADANVSIKGVSGANNSTAALKVGVKPAPGFNLTASPASVTVTKGSVAAFTFAVETVGSLNQAVSLSMAGLPAGVTPSIAPAGAGKVALTIPTTPATGAKTYTITTTGSAGTLRKVVDVTLIVK
jgi:hypothetical protein